MFNNQIDPISPERKAYEYIYNDIISRRYFPGSRLIEDDIAKEIGLSRTPIRAAIKQLGYEGLVTIPPRKGAYISYPNKDEIACAYRCRCILESEAIYQACKYITDEEINELERMLKAEESLRNEKKFSEYLEINKQFHMVIAKASHNVFLAKYISELVGKCNVYLIFFDRFNTTNNENSSAYHAHREILTALSNRDGDSAATAIQRHITRTVSELEL